MKIKAIKLFEAEKVLNGYNTTNARQPGILDDNTIPSKISYKLSRISKEIDKELKTVREEINKIHKKHAELDEKGNIKINDDKSFVFKKGEREKSIKEAEKFAEELDVDINCWTLNLYELSNIKISGRQILAIDWLIEEEKEKKGK